MIDKCVGTASKHLASFPFLELPQGQRCSVGVRTGCPWATRKTPGLFSVVKTLPHADLTSWHHCGSAQNWAGQRGTTSGLFPGVLGQVCDTHNTVVTVLLAGALDDKPVFNLKLPSVRSLQGPTKASSFKSLGVRWGGGITLLLTFEGMQIAKKHTAKHHGSPRWRDSGMEGSGWQIKHFFPSKGPPQPPHREGNRLPTQRKYENKYLKAHFSCLLVLLSDDPDWLPWAHMQEYQHRSCSSTQHLLLAHTR